MTQIGRRMHGLEPLVLVIVAVVGAATPAPASDCFINLGTNIQSYNWRPGQESVELGYLRRSVSLICTYMRGDRAGPYAQLAPYLALSNASSSGSVFRYFQNQSYGGGLNFAVGYGTDANLGRLGVLLGGGLFGSGCASYDAPRESLYWEGALGLGGGARLYVRLGSGSLAINVGLDFFWRPLRLYGASGSSVFELNSRNTNGSASAGIGFRR